MGDVRHFKIKGLQGDFAGMKGGPSGQQVYQAPEFVRTRENMNEFGGCALAAKSIRTGLAQLLNKMSDPQLAGRLTAIMKKINLEDQSEVRGRRAILISTQRKYLAGLNFDKNTSFEGIFFAPFTLALTNTGERSSITLTVPPFHPADLVRAPAGATHFRLVNALSVISDFEYNDTTGVYEPIEPALNELSALLYTNYIALDGTAVTGLTDAIAALAGTPALTDNVSVLASVGIEFYQYAGERYFPFSSGSALKIQAIF
jgi:hypothetical protein